MSAKKASVPYASTKVDPEDTKAAITKLLKANGVEPQWIQWTGDVLRFAVSYEQGGEKRSLGFEIRPPRLTALKRSWNEEKGRYEKLDVALPAQSMRLLYWYVDAKMKATRWGLSDVQREWMPNIVIPGTDTTVGDVVAQRIESGDLGRLALTDQSGEKRETIAASFEVKEVAER